jgi:hypothetical protein
MHPDGALVTYQHRPTVQLRSVIDIFGCPRPEPPLGADVGSIRIEMRV